MTAERLSDFAVNTMHANTVTFDRRLAYEKFVALLLRRMMASSLFADYQVDSKTVSQLFCLLEQLNLYFCVIGGMIYYH